MGLCRLTYYKLLLHMGAMSVIELLAKNKIKMVVWEESNIIL